MSTNSSETPALGLGARRNGLGRQVSEELMPA